MHISCIYETAYCCVLFYRSLNRYIQQTGICNYIQSYTHLGKKYNQICIEYALYMQLYAHNLHRICQCVVFKIAKCAVICRQKICINIHKPMLQASICGWVLARLQVLQNSVSLMFMSRVWTLPVSVQDCHSWNDHWNQRKKIVENAAIQKSMCQCTDWLSAMQNGQGTAESFTILMESKPSLPTHCNLP